MWITSAWQERIIGVDSQKNKKNTFACCFKSDTVRGKIPGLLHLIFHDFSRVLHQNIFLGLSHLKILIIFKIQWLSNVCTNTVSCHVCWHGIRHISLCAVNAEYKHRMNIDSGYLNPGDIYHTSKISYGWITKFLPGLIIINSCFWQCLKLLCYIM